MVDKKLGVHTEQFVQKIFIAVGIGRTHGTQRNVPHCVYAVFFKLFGVPFADPPKIGNGSMFPKLTAVGHFVKLCNPHAVFIGGNFFSNDVHSDFAKIQIRTNARRGGNPRRGKNVPDYRHCKLSGGHFVGLEIGRNVHKNLVDRVHHNIFGSDIFKIYLVNFRAVVHIMRHSGRRDNIVNGKCGVGLYFAVKIGFFGKFKLVIPRRFSVIVKTLCVHCFYSLHYFKKSCPARNTVLLQGRRYRKAYGLFCAALVGYHKVCVKRVKSAFHALDRGVEAFQVDCNILAFHIPAPFRTISKNIIPISEEKINW